MAKTSKRTFYVVVAVEVWTAGDQQTRHTVLVEVSTAGLATAQRRAMLDAAAAVRECYPRQATVRAKYVKACHDSAYVISARMAPSGLKEKYDALDTYELAVLRDLRNVTEGCRSDMHEPDEQGLAARVQGRSFDNAGVDGELTLRLTRGGSFWNVNLATLVALARRNLPQTAYTVDA